jgi:hypothetical protein
LGCTSFHLAALADGLGDPLATAIYSYRIYDIAAALAILSSCGIVIFDLTKSRQIDYAELIALPRKQLDCRPLLVGHPDALAKLEDRVKLKSESVVAVDGNNRRPNPAARKLCLELGLWHRSVHIEICRKNKFLVLRLRDGRLEIPAGPVNWLFTENRPESYDEAATRIVFQVLAIAANSPFENDQDDEKRELSLAEISRLSVERIAGNRIRKEHILVFRLTWKSHWLEPVLFESFGGKDTWKPVWLNREKILVQKARGVPMNDAMSLFSERLATGDQMK